MSDSVSSPDGEKTTLLIGSQSFFALAGELLAAGKRVSITPTGSSMLPTLRGGRDTVVLVPPGEKKLRRGDIILYRRLDGTYVLHRIVKVCKPSQRYTLCGDNQIAPERGIGREQVLAVVRSLRRGSRQIDCDGLFFRLYSEIWMALRFPRQVYHYLKRRVSGIFR
ncbi:MAG: S24/S26 family peptidase [Thermoguttaceae bacterium]|nr:S24/S26 family peptidase [Thermoguttaceae bacterium]